MSTQQGEEDQTPQNQEQFFDHSEGLAEYTSNPAEDVPPRFRQLLFGHVTKMMGLTKLDPKPAQAQMYALKADIIFIKFCISPLEADEPTFVNGLLESENYVKLMHYQSRYPNPKLILLLKQFLVREGTSQTIPAPTPQKRGLFGR